MSVPKISNQKEIVNKPVRWQIKQNYILLEHYSGELKKSLKRKTRNQTEKIFEWLKCSFRCSQST